jgi:hypothetical protein
VHSQIHISCNDLSAVLSHRLQARVVGGVVARIDEGWLILRLEEVLLGRSGPISLPAVPHIEVHLRSANATSADRLLVEWNMSIWGLTGLPAQLAKRAAYPFIKQQIGALPALEHALQRFDNSSLELLTPELRIGAARVGDLIQVASACIPSPEGAAIAIAGAYSAVSRERAPDGAPR